MHKIYTYLGPNYEYAHYLFNWEVSFIQPDSLDKQVSQFTYVPRPPHCRWQSVLAQRRNFDSRRNLWALNQVDGVAIAITTLLEKNIIMLTPWVKIDSYTDWLSYLKQCRQIHWKFLCMAEPVRSWGHPWYWCKRSCNNQFMCKMSIYRPIQVT